MKKYELKVWQATWEHCYVTVEAEDENEAREKAYDEATSSATLWMLDDIEITGMEILSEEPTHA